MTARDALAAIRDPADVPGRGPWIPALVKALEAVLDLADKWDRLANEDGTKDVAGWRMQVKAKQIREAVEAALEGR